MTTKVFLLMVCLTVSLQTWARPLPEQDGNAAAILTEIGRLRDKLTALQVSKDEADGINSLLGRSERAAKAGHVFLSLHILQYAVPNYAGLSFQRAQTAQGITSMPSLEKLWQQLGPELTVRQRRLTASPKLPLAVQAVIERALTQVQPNYQASLLYGQEAGIENGLYYLGQAQGQLDFTAFCRTLKFAAPAPAPLPAPDAELAAMEADVLAAYRQHDTPEQHSAFIRVNSALKVAQDLLRERRTNGVWLQTLEARRALAAILVTASENRSADDLRGQCETVRTKLSTSAADHSLGWFYWQMAESALAADDLKAANAILHHVLPRYFNALRKKP